MNVYFYSNFIWIDVAFDGGDCQLCYEGIYNQGHNNISSFIPDFFESDRMYEDLNRISELSPQDLRDQLLHAQKTNIIISNENYLKDTSSSINGIEGSRSISVTNYGISHECNEFGVTYPEDLPDYYWEPQSCIDIAFHRYLPSEAIVKSDLQFYNKDYVDMVPPYGNGYIRNIRAYSMGTHGGPHWETYKKVWLWWPPGWEYVWVSDINPNEISALWYTDFARGYEINVYPLYTIIMSDSCFGYYQPPSDDPTMAKAFVNYGANVFVGATINTDPYSDDYMLAFWHDLCQDDETVETSTITLCETHGNGWDLGDEWRIYGDEDAVLPN